ncbi:uncharacterized protein LOC113081304 isoform X2 [Carassius auratus]|uniref:Uncharacterized protein LOC113081304 isoform X2 n=1 Tax=Carassius auratus TaxID=7957 RepID=A0A6P6NLV8_CARAU|nr:uncharacterized protein LOC113081304 isoform X2 [Carassius auratus]
MNAPQFDDKYELFPCNIVMASSTEKPRISGAEEKQTVKARLLSSQMLLVDALYHLSPLLDCVISAGLLSRENCYEIEAERTPPNKVRKLLEIIDAQMDESGASSFMECLRKCKKHYPRLRTWLTSEEDHFQPTGITQGPTERQLQVQFNVLCSRLGCSVLPVSFDLFSRAILTQLELEKIQAILIPTQQAQTLLSICLKKGEKACKSFYTALKNEDEQLAEELNVKCLVEDLDKKPESSIVPIAVEETRGHLMAFPLSGGLQQVMTRLGLTVGDEIRFNVCEVGVAVGLPRRTVREYFLEGVGIEDSAQLEALVSLYIEKTKDAERLLSRVAELSPRWVQLSERGCLLLRLLQKAETLLRSGIHSHRHGWDHLHDQDQLRSWDHLCPEDCTDQRTVWAIFSFLVWDCMAEVLEEPEAKPSGGILGMIEQLSASGRVEAALLQEVEQCWTEGDAESLLQSVRVLAQVLRDLHPLQEGLQLSSSVEGLFSCRPSRLHRVTSFQGVSARVIRRALSSMVPSSSDQDTTPLARQHMEACVRIARLLDVVQPKRTTVDFSNAPTATVIQHVQSVLSNPAFNSEAFDAGVRHRLLSVLEFNPAQLGLGSLMQLHQETLSEFQTYLQLGEHHNFQFILESVRILGTAKLFSVSRVHGPVAIDNGVEEVIRFITSEPTSFLVRLHCLCYEEGRGRFKVCTPRCACMYLLKAEGLRDMQWCGGNVLAEMDGKVWVREGESNGWDELQTLAQRHSAQLKDEGCCFKVKTSGLECEVKFIYRSGRLWATPHRDCEVD